MPAHAHFRFQTRIRFADTDVSGRIHNTALLRYFESAETEFLRTLGVSYGLRDGFAFPRVHVECDFMLALGFDDLIDIDVHLAKVGRSSIRFEYLTFKGEALAAKGVVIAVWVDLATGKAAPIPDDLRAKLAGAMTQF